MQRGGAGSAGGGVGGGGAHMRAAKSLEDLCSLAQAPGGLLVDNNIRLLGPGELLLLYQDLVVFYVAGDDSEIIP